LYIFLVFVVIFLWHVKFKCVKSCSSSATIYELRARSMLPLDGVALFVTLFTAYHCHFLLYKALSLFLVSAVIQHAPSCRIMSRTLTMTFIGTEIRSRPLPTVLLTTRPHKVPPATLFEPAASFIPVCPHPRVLSLDLTRYKSDRTEIRSRRPHDTSQPDAASFCGIRDVFYRWTKVRIPPPSDSLVFD
jgi:hypothetical protein